MISLPITSLIAAALAVILVVLSVTVSARRGRIQAMIGDQGDEVLLRRIRAQGNFIEYAPLALIIIALVELGGAAGWIVWSLGGALVVGRLLHAAGLLTTSTPLRAGGMLLTFLTLLVGAVLLVMAAV